MNNGMPTSVPEGGTIWIDLDNTPHVPLFAPIAAELERRGFRVVLSARDAFQVCELAQKKGLTCRKIGRHSGKNKFRKLAGLLCRALQLLPVALRDKPVIGLSHGSRSQILACNLLGIPTVLMADYEFAQYPPMMRPTWEMAPDVIPDSALSCRPDRILKYPGIKEDVYVPEFRADPTLRSTLGLGAESIIAVVRPPATEAHYHNPEAEGLFARFMDRACRTDQVRVVLLPRNKKQGDLIKTTWPGWFEKGRTIIPKEAVDGLNLIWNADLVMSGGGTMNREAAALHVPVYSVFRGKIGAVDQQLQKEGRLVLAQTIEEVDRIALVRRTQNGNGDATTAPALAAVVQNIIHVVQRHAA
jgi:predicted glycosyltransferase